MGCVCSGESDIEQFLTDFIDELRIRKYNEKNFFLYLDKNSPYKTLRSNYEEFLKSRQNEEIHKNYLNILFSRNHHLFYVSLILLIQCDHKNLSNNYKLILEKVKNSHAEYQKETDETLIKSDYEILYEVLIFYVRMVSFDIIEAAGKSKENKLNEEQVNVLRANYGEKIIDYFVRSLMKGCRNPDIDLDEFFRKNFSVLKHASVRERLRKIYEDKDSLLNNNNDSDLVCRQKPQTSKEALEENNHKKYEYVLPNIDYKGNNGISQENYGSNNYNNINNIEEEECVEAGNPGIEMDLEAENNRIKMEMEKLKIDQYNTYRRECLVHHNRIREKHGVPALRESDSLSQFAQTWANYISETDCLTHSSMIWDGKMVGENIAKAGAIINDPSELIVNKWYEEKDNFDFSNKSSQNNTKNFTQMVWKNTESIGFGLAYSQSGNTFIVINYYPSGNLPQEYEENVTLPQN